MEYTSDTESSDGFHLWSAVTIIGAATKRQVSLKLGQFTIFPNHYTIIVGPSGARKSAAVGIVEKLAQQSGIRKFSDKITGAALIKDLSEGMEKKVDVANGTVELTSPLLIYSSELGVFMGPDAYGSGVIADLTDLYDCPAKWEKKTVSRGAESVMGPYVSMLAASTPQTIKDVIPAPSVGQGFTSRIIFVWGGRRRKRVPIPDYDEGHKMLERNLVHDLKEISKLSGEFHFSQAALRLYKRHYNERPEPEDEYEDERLRGYSSRKDVHLLKLAMVLSLADNDSLELSERDISGAIEGINWLDQGFPSVFAGVGRSAAAEDCSRIYREVDLDTRKFGFATYSNIIRKNYNNLNSQEVDLVLKTLLEGGAIVEAYKKDTKGRFVRTFVTGEGKDVWGQKMTRLPRRFTDGENR
jgi:hypothetical protein